MDTRQKTGSLASMEERNLAKSDDEKMSIGNDNRTTEHNTLKDVSNGSSSSSTIEGDPTILPNDLPSKEHKNPKDTSNSSSSTSIIEDPPLTTTTATNNDPSPPDEPEASRTTLQTFVIMASLCASVFLAALDMTIVTTALPTIAQHFGSSAGYTWIGSAYLLANAASVPSWGKISDIWGRKPVLLVAAAIFFVGSLLAGVSISIGMLIAARAIQGVGSGGLIILVNISISDLFSMRNRGSYYGLIGMVWALASAVGPILGGVFTSRISWRWCFYVNLPITGLVFILLYFFLHLHNPKTPALEGLKAIDWAGSLLVVGGTLMLLLGLEFGGVIYPWRSATVICLIVFGVTVSILFIINEWKFARYPVMPLRLFKHRNNIASFATCFCHGFVFIAGTYYLPLYFQSVLGASPLMSGVYILPFAVTLSLVSAATGIYIKKTGKYLPPIWTGLFIMTLGFGLYIDFPYDRNWTKIILYQIVAGIGVGPNFQSPLIALQTMVKPGDIAVATATFGFVRNLSTSISVVIGGVVFQNEMQSRQAALTLSLGAETAAKLSGGSAGASVDLVARLPPMERDVARLAFWGSLRVMWIVYVVFAAVGLASSAFIGQQELTKKHEVTKTGLVAEEAKRLEEVERRRVKKDREKGGSKEEV